MLNQMHEAYWKIRTLHRAMQDGALTAATSINGITIMASVDDTEHGRLIRYSMTNGRYGYTTRNATRAINILFNALVFVS